MGPAKSVAELVAAVPVTVGAVEVPAKSRWTGRSGGDGIRLRGRRNPRGQAAHKEPTISDHAVIVRTGIGAGTDIDSAQGDELSVDLRCAERRCRRRCCGRGCQLKPSNRVRPAKPRLDQAYVGPAGLMGNGWRAHCVPEPNQPHAQWHRLLEGDRAQRQPRQRGHWRARRAPDRPPPTPKRPSGSEVVRYAEVETVVEVGAA